MRLASTANDGWSAEVGHLSNGLQPWGEGMGPVDDGRRCFFATAILARRVGPA